jgi:hypothetical protein
MDHAEQSDALWWMTTPKNAMWKAIVVDYMLFSKSSYTACTPPVGNPPTPALIATAKTQSQLIFSTIAWLATRHCFDATYLSCFHPNADNTLMCPCKTLACGADDHAMVFVFPWPDLEPPNPIITMLGPDDEVKAEIATHNHTHTPLQTTGCLTPPTPPTPPISPRPKQVLYTKEHILFNCPLTQPFRDMHLIGITSLRDTFRSV